MTLEWVTESPPAEHNFEFIPPIRSERPVWDLNHPDKPTVPHGRHAKELARAAKVGAGVGTGAGLQASSNGGDHDGGGNGYGDGSGQGDGSGKGLGDGHDGSTEGT
jgi:hypothetical protein